MASHNLKGFIEILLKIILRNLSLDKKNKIIKS